LKGSPDPPLPYRSELAFPRLKFTHPVVLAKAPGSTRLFLAEQEGKVYSFPDEPDGAKADLLFDLLKAVPSSSSIYGLTFHPRFEENRHAYLSYVLQGEEPEGARVSRFEVSRSDPPAIDPATEKILITWRAGGHNGGCLEFGPDGFLYVSTGDATAPSPPDVLDTGQDLSDLLSSILRIDVDHGEGGRGYAVPPDNPFRSLEGARPEIWAYGLRNPWKMSFDPATGDLWVGDVGWELWEMVYRVERGGNYGWSVMEGRQPVRPGAKTGPTPILPPVVDHPHSEAASVTGGVVYHGKRMADLEGAYIYGDYVTGRIWGLRHDGHRVTWHRELASTSLKIVAFAQDRSGELLFLDHEPSGQIYRLIPSLTEAANSDFPRLLSKTGLFSSVKDRRPAPGVIPYTVSAEPWCEGASAERLLALPGGASADFEAEGSWRFPSGTALVKTLSVEPGPGKARRPIETQVLLCDENVWRPYTYAWNEEASDAVLVEGSGPARKQELAGKPSVGSQQPRWRLMSRGECSLCHNALAGYVLGVNTLELNHDVERSGVAENQLRVLEQAGVFSHELPKSTEKLPRLVNPCSPQGDVSQRARSYLHINCSHCHRSGGGGTATIELLGNLDLKLTHTVGATPLQGTFGLANARIIAPGDPYSSVLYYRMAKAGSGHMPRLGARAIDEKGLALIHDWIAGLSPTGNGAPGSSGEEETLLSVLQGDASSREERAEIIRRLASSARGSLVLLRWMDCGSLPETVREEVKTITREHSSDDVRDLFERFLPEDQRRKRRDGPIDAGEILAGKGDAASGRAIFFSDSAPQCKSCHRIENEGGAFGPDLSHIGKKYSRSQLLEQTLSPSRDIAPEFAGYSLVTEEGEVFSGLVVEKSDKEVALKDMEGHVFRVRASEIKTFERQEKSLMPELLLEDLPNQAIADLIAYLASLQ
jgi:uncharacterized repeat protein (TIGR03806 family)